jgi:transcriptional regulator with XRE-family HTH domain
VAHQQGSIIRRRILARRLEQLRRKAGLSLEQAAPLLDWSVSKLSRIENAAQSVDVHGVRSMLDLYEAGDDWTELVELAREARKRQWWHAYGLRRQPFYVGYETEAVLMHEFTVGYLPGLFQTADYARALFTATPVPRTAQQLENEIKVRMIRQGRLTSDDHPLELVAVLEESTLLRPIGGRPVMRAQLEHLVGACALDSVTVHVLPTSVGAHAALGSGLVVLNFGDLNEPDVAYVEHALGALFLEKEDEVARAKLTFDLVRAQALDPAESLALIGRLAEQI